MMEINIKFDAPQWPAHRIFVSLPHKNRNNKPNFFHQPCNPANLVTL